MSDTTKLPNQTILTQSEKMSQEYCCNVIRVGELFPIEGSDFLVQTFINGDSVVVRKDEIQTGQVYFFAMCECQLNEKYLGHHSMFRRSAAKKNANYEILKPDLDALEAAKENLDHLKYAKKKLVRLQNKATYNDADKKKINNMCDTDCTEKDDKSIKTDLNESIQKITSSIESHEHIIKELQTKLDKSCGFFEANCRIKGIRLKGTPSMGLLFSKETLAAVWPEVATLNLEELIGYDFDTVMGELFCKVYVPPMPKSSSRGGRITDNHLAQNLIENEFLFHYDTSILGKNMWKFKPDDVIDVTDKIHGTSFIMSNCQVNYTKVLPFYKRWWNKLSDLTHCTSWKFATHHTGYGEVYSSRKVIRNKSFIDGIMEVYGESIYDLWASVLSGYIGPDTTVYAEIYGQDPYTCKMVQPGYDYGCEPGETKLMPYRITKLDRETGVHTEYTIQEVIKWTESLRAVFVNCSDFKCSIVPLTHYYHGKFKDLYPDIPVDENWESTVLLKMMNEPRFHMEEMEMACKVPVPKEGVVIRKESERIPAAYKLKCVKFKERERQVIDSGSVSDTEMEEAYGS